jgi:hypothetical protein
VRIVGEKKVNSNFLSLNLPFVTLLISFAFSAVVKAEPAVCSLLNKKKEQALYLVDRNGDLVKGPIDFGQYGVDKDFVADYIAVPTQYRFVVSPARIEVKSQQCNMCLDLKKIAPICPNTSAYSISVGMSFRSKGSTRPYKEDALIELEFNDPKADYDASVKMKFDSRIIGELVAPNK